MTETQNEAKEPEPQAKESQVFMIEGELRDAWGRPADGDESVDFNAGKYDELKGPQLKEEVKRRQAAGREIDTSGLRTVRDVRAALEADDQKQLEEARQAAEDDEDKE